MRIIHFLNHSLCGNGHVNVAVDLACVQSKSGHSVLLISGGGDYDAILTAHGVQHIVIAQERKVGTLLKAIFKLRSAIASFAPEIVHSHMMTSTALAFVLRPFMKFKLVTTVHNEFEPRAILMGLGDIVIAVSEAVRDSMERRGVPRKKLRVVLNGTIGSPRLNPTPPPPQQLRHPAILFVGGLHPRKGVQDLIAAFKTAGSALPDAHLYLVGDGPHYENFKALAAETGHGDRITFCGYQSDPRAYLLGADLFILPSHSEPASLVLAEAREAGCAIIATAVGGSPQMLDGGKAGILVPARRPDLLSEAIVQVIGDPTLLAELRARAHSNLDYFTVRRASDECVALYQEAVG
jgi:glycosyltransferase involved in cell wall biosynthesis